MRECQVHYFTFERICQNPLLQSLLDRVLQFRLRCSWEPGVPVLLCYAVSYLWFSCSEVFGLLGCRAILLPLKCAKNGRLRWYKVEDSRPQITVSDPLP